MKLFQKILLAPALAVLLLIIFGAVSYQALREQHTTIDELFSTRQDHLRVAFELRGSVRTTHTAAYRVLTWGGSMGEAYIDKEVKALRNAQ